MPMIEDESFKLIVHSEDGGRVALVRRGNGWKFPEGDFGDRGTYIESVNQVARQLGITVNGYLLLAGNGSANHWIQVGEIKKSDDKLRRNVKWFELKKINQILPEEVIRSIPKEVKKYFGIS